MLCGHPAGTHRFDPDGAEDALDRMASDIALRGSCP